MTDKKYFAALFLFMLLYFACDEDYNRINFGEVETGEAFDITRRSAKLSGVVKGLLREEDRIDDHGFVWALQKEDVENALLSVENLNNFPSSRKRRQGPTSRNGRFEAVITDLESDEEFFFAAFGIVDDKVFFEGIKSFNTLEFINLTVEKWLESTRNSVTVTSQVDGLLPTDVVLRRGHTWADTLVEPDIDIYPYSEAPLSQSNGSFVSKMEPLTVGEQYVLWPFLEVRIREASGDTTLVLYSPNFEGVNFRPDPIEVTTGTATEITGSSAVIERSEVKNLLDSEYPPSSVGVRLLPDNRFFPGELNIGNWFNVELRSLKQSQQYEAIAFAVVNSDTTWGDPAGFETIIDVIVRPPSNIRLTGLHKAEAIFSAEGANASTVTEYGLCWSSSTIQPTADDNEGSITRSTFPVSSGYVVITGLVLSTDYMVRAFTRLNNDTGNYIYGPQGPGVHMKTISLSLELGAEFDDDDDEIDADIMISIETPSSTPVSDFGITFSEIFLVWSETIAEPDEINNDDSVLGATSQAFLITNSSDGVLGTYHIPIDITGLTATTYNMRAIAICGPDIFRSNVVTIEID